MGMNIENGNTVHAVTAYNNIPLNARNVYSCDEMNTRIVWLYTDITFLYME